MKPYYYILRLGALSASLATLAAPLGLIAASAIPGLLVMVALLSGVAYAIKPLVFGLPQRPHPEHEDEFDAAVSAWKTVYGEDIGYNEHAVTLEWLGSLHRNNVLTSDQLADACESVEWVTWALGQPEQGTLASARAEQQQAIALLTAEERPARRGGSWLTVEQITEKLAELETRAAEQPYCDGSHTREQSLADTIPETINDWR